MSIKLFHRYIGLLLCLIMLSISLTGVVLIWKKEYLWLSVDGARESVDTSLLAKAIENIEASYADDEVTFVQLYSEDLSIHKSVPEWPPLRLAYSIWAIRFRFGQVMSDGKIFF